MSIVTLIGDGTSTATLAVASGWQDAEPPLVVEADPSGGSLAAWLDTPAVPSLATVVAQLTRSRDRTAGSVVDIVDALQPSIHRPPSGIAFLGAPTRAIAAARAVEEAADVIFPALAETDELIALVDAGRHPGHLPLPDVLRHSDVIVACHRQSRASARAGAVRLERFAEQIAMWSGGGRALIPVVTGDEPFDPDEIARFLVAQSNGAPIHAVHVLADDPLAAAVLAGREGVSAKRLRRLPLMRTAAELAQRASDAVHEQRFGTLPTPHRGVGGRS